MLLVVHGYLFKPVTEMVHRVNNSRDWLEQIIMDNQEHHRITS